MAINPQDLDYQPQNPNKEQPEWDGKGFDLRVHVKDAKTGELIRHQPYNRHCVGRFVYYERPIGSGNLFFGDGKPAGRWLKNDAGEMYANTSSSHIAYEAPEARRLTVEAMQTVEQENATLKAELEALRAQAAAVAGSGAGSAGTASTALTGNANRGR